MRTVIMFLLVFTSLVKTSLLCAQLTEGITPIDFNKSHVIAVVTTGDREILDFLKRKLPHAFELFEVKEEKEGGHEKYWGMLIVKYIKKTSKTQWTFRNKATDDRIEISLTPKEKYFSTNWERISEKGYRKPGPSDRASDWEGKLARDKVPDLSISINSRDLSILITALKDKSLSIRTWTAEALDRIDHNWRNSKAGGQAIPVFIADLKNEHFSIREGASWALGVISNPLAVGPLIAVLKDEFASVRSTGVWALGEIKDPQAIEPLIESLKDNDFTVRYAAKYALEKITNQGFGDDIIKWQEWWEKNKGK